MLNQTSVTEFLLLGVTDIQVLKPVLFVIFLAIYIVNVAVNGVILMVVISDSRLHSPMYFFLGNLSCLDICFSTVTLPKMLENFLSTHKTISFLGCISQLHFFHFLGSTEAMLLAVMAFDRFVAICKPLRYTVIMNHQVCTQVAVTVWIIGFFHALLHSVMTSRINFCGSNRIHHFFCDVKPLLELACGDTDLNEWLLHSIILATALLILCPFGLILGSYGRILATIFRIPSAAGRLKAFSTCSSHLLVVCVFYGTAIFIYIRPKASYDPASDPLVSLFYAVVTPILNPIIYSLRNADVKAALKRTIQKMGPAKI
ncbi:unnamed protein product [Rangifer tarandus platyrhynchus]|uniref:Olfactory receptor n=1 Tax=Rangifer tarandus platyrhynchus TaxID=3082113 RepID=A0ABN8Z939_RANTA|nr:unnamed protein product [Rangifer tarandus platyrhynchus]